MTVSTHSLSARFLGEAGGRFLCLHYQPAVSPAAHIIYIPPFGEEMNRCRALAAAQARQFADAGYSCTIMDLFGTGDSEGELYEASFAIWYENISTLIKTLLRDDDVPVILWGLRLGGLLALDYTRRSSLAIQNIILWQPVTAGKRFVTQMLRQRVASLVGKDLPPETTQQIRQRLEEGENVEISGYTVGGALLRDMEQTDFSAMVNLCPGKIYWLENVSDHEQPASTASRKMIDQLQGQDNNIELHLFADPPLWQLHKRDNAPELLDITGRLLS